MKKLSVAKKIKLNKILNDNKDKICLQKGPLGHYNFDTHYDLNDLKLPKNFKYVQRLYDENGGGQFSIIDGDETLGSINIHK